MLAPPEPPGAMSLIEADERRDDDILRLASSSASRGGLNNTIYEAKACVRKAGNWTVMFGLGQNCITAVTVME